MTRKKNPRCPNCGYGRLWLYETAEHTLTWTLNKDALESFSNEPGPVTRVDAECMMCKHKWRLRGIFQVSQIPAYHAEVHDA